MKIMILILGASKKFLYLFIREYVFGFILMGLVYFLVETLQQ